MESSPNAFSGPMVVSESAEQRWSWERFHILVLFAIDKIASSRFHIEFLQSTLKMDCIGKTCASASSRAYVPPPDARRSAEFAFLHRPEPNRPYRAQASSRADMMH